MFAGLRRARLRPARLKRAEERRNVNRSKPLFRTLRRIPPSDCSFTPAAGYRHPASGVLSHVGTEGDLWSSSPYVSDGSGASRAGSIHFSASSMFMLNITDRASALSVRCVQASAQKLPFLRMHAPGPGVFPSSPETFSFSAQPSVRRMDRLSVNRSKIC